MARTWVARTDLVEGTLPAVCVRSGQPTDHGRPVRVQAGSSSGPAALLVSLIPAELGLVVGPGAIKGAVPMRRSASQQLTRLGQVRTWSAALGAALIVLGLVLDLTLVTVLGALALVVAGIWAMLTLARTVTGHLDDSGDWVELRGVHPRFVAAADGRYAQEER